MEKQTSLPSEESKRKLKELTDALKPDDVKFLVALNSDSSIEECMEDGAHVVSGLKKYIDGNHSKDGLTKYFGEIETF